MSASRSRSPRRNGYYVNSDADLEAYKRDGFLIIRGLFNQDETALIKAAAEEGVFREHSGEARCGKGGGTRVTTWSKPGDDTLGYVARSRRVVQTMWRCLGGGAIPIHKHSKIINKEVGSAGAFDWHQDYGTYYNEGFVWPHLAAIQIAVDPTTRENGCLKVLRGSHDLGRVNHIERPGETAVADPERVAFVMEQGAYEEVYCEMNPGDAVLFSGLTMHGSEANNSAKRRMVFQSVFSRADNPQGPHSGNLCFYVDEVADSRLLQEGLGVASHVTNVFHRGPDGKFHESDTQTAISCKAVPCHPGRF